MENIIKTLNYDCPFCEQIHEISVIKKKSRCLIKDEVIDYEGTVYHCSIEDDDFAPGDIFIENLSNARKEYEKHHSN